MSTDSVLPMLRQQLELQEKNIALQKQLIQALETVDKASLEHNSTTIDVRSPQISRMESRPESERSRLATEGMEPSLEASEIRAKASAPSVLRMYCRFLLSGDVLKCFTEHPEWEELTTESMSGPRLREKLISTLETLMVFYTLMLTIGVDVLHGMENVQVTFDLVVLCLSYFVAALSFMATTIVFCTLKMVLAVSDCNLKLWCKANSHVFNIMSFTHNMITVSTGVLLTLLFFRALPAQQAFPVSVEIGLKVGIGLFSLVLVVTTGATVCAPARSAGHAGAISELPVCSDATCTQATHEDARRILYKDAFESKLDTLLDFYRAGGGQDGNTSGSDAKTFIRRGGILKRRVLQ